jgi:hypothetical protein
MRPDTFSGMKTFLSAVLFLCTAFAAVHADIPVSHPTELIVSNLSAFPKFKFMIAQGDASPALLEENKMYRLRAETKLLILSADGKPHAWATIAPFMPRFRPVKIIVKRITVSHGEFDVIYDRTVETVPTQPGSSGASTGGSASPYFLLATLASCGLVLLARRRT